MKISEFIINTSWNSFRRAEQEHVKKLFLDLTASLCAGTKNNSAKCAADYSKSCFPGNDATILATGDKCSLIGASLANAMAANALDIDDGYSLTKGHPGAGIIGALIPAAEITNCTYAEFLTTLIIGYEVTIRQGLCIQNYYNFYHSSGSYAAMGAATCISKLFGLNIEETENALGISDYFAPMVPCMRSVEQPTMNKDGIYFGTQIGVQSALQAKFGITGRNAILTEEKYRYLTDTLGTKYYMYDLYFKFYSCCRWAQSGICAVEELLIKYHVKASDIREITVYSYGASGALFSGVPQNESEAQYNLKYPIAAMILFGNCGPLESSTERMNDPRVADIMSRISFEKDEEYEKAFPAKRYSRVKITTNDNNVYMSSACEPRGDDCKSISVDEICQKAYSINSIYTDRDCITDMINTILSSSTDMPFARILDSIKRVSVSS